MCPEEELKLIESLSEAKIKRILTDPEKSAGAINLVYVNDRETDGISRKKKGKKFAYFLQGLQIKDKEEIDRINKLVIPPAWEEVWICSLQNGHLQATGLDAVHRKQYKYHAAWSMLRNHTKFFRMRQFGEALPALRLGLEKDLSIKSLEKRKVLAAVVSLMERTNIRVGNSVYERLYGSFGLTTLKDKHVKIDKTKLNFAFVGKKGIRHDIQLKSKKLARIVSQCKEIPGKDLFQYYDDEGNRHGIDSGMVNEYIKELSGSDFTAKDFRTWAGTVNAFIALKEIGLADDESDVKHNIVSALDTVAEHLGNTRTVCRKYYIHPSIISMYESRKIERYFKELDKIEVDDGSAGLTADEKIIMKILSTH
ncbi:MAG TPA: hypothetical protein PK076_01755 [Saprospiraceae bacterium]|nr:hypothetical protein [Saprospiraceae bacterium]